MRSPSSAELPIVRSALRDGYELLRVVWRTARGGGSTRSPGRGRRAPPADGALLRPGRLDAALAAARRRGLARRGVTVPEGGHRGGHTLRGPRRRGAGGRPPHLL